MMRLRLAQLAGQVEETPVCIGNRIGQATSEGFFLFNFFWRSPKHYPLVIKKTRNMPHSSLFKSHDALNLLEMVIFQVAIVAR